MSNSGAAPRRAAPQDVPQQGIRNRNPKADRPALRCRTCGNRIRYREGCDGNGRRENQNSMNPCLFLDTSRAQINVAGAEATDFLQDLVTNDVTRLTRSRAIYAALLTPQGKYLVDFILAMREDGSVQLDLPASALPDTLRRLAAYKLRRKVVIEPTESLPVGCLFVPGAAEAVGASGDPGDCHFRDGHTALVDPRDASLGIRIYGKNIAGWLGKISWRPATEGEWDAHRIERCVPEGGKDLLPESVFLLEARFEDMNGVDFRKGCYVGQEVTARMRHRASLRRQIRRVRFAGAAPKAGTEIRADGKPAGTLLTSAPGGLALARLRLDRAEGARELNAEGIPLELLPDRDR